MSIDGDGGQSRNPSTGLGSQPDAIEAVQASKDGPHGVARTVKPSGKWTDSETLDSDIGKEWMELPSRVTSRPHLSRRHFTSRVRRARDTFVEASKTWYQRYIIRGLLRQKDLPQTKDGRHIILDAHRSTSLFDERTGHHYVNNTIRSSRYTIWTFIPFQLWFQFTKAANVYFLIMGILQLIPGLSTTGTFTTILPLLFFLVLCMAREGYDDYRRYRLDKTENRRLARVLHGFRPGGVNAQIPKTLESTTRRIREDSVARLRHQPGRAVPISTNLGSEQKDLPRRTPSSLSLNSEVDPWAPAARDPDPWATVKWIDLQVGDIIEVKRDCHVPADIVLLHTDGRNGFAYVETMALDGETNLKTRRPPAGLAESCDSLTKLSMCRAQFAVEDPNLDLYEFNGKVTIGEKTVPLTLNHVIYRGCTLRNTNRTIGMIINTGEECKIRMNSSKYPQTKAPVMQKTANRVVWILSAFVVLLSVGCSAGYLIWTPVYEDKAWYLAGGHVIFADILIAFVIMYNNFIPLALYVSLEIVKFFQFLMLQDMEMYDEESDTPMVSNTQTMFENLGQINFIFSDKTGTLTDNVMRFRKFTVAGIAWLHKAEKAKEQDGGALVIGASQTTGETTETISGGASKSPTAIAMNRTTSSGTIPQDSESSAIELDTTELIRYLQKNPETVFSQRTRQFLLSLALCHTCFPEVHQNGEITYQAASPDELALVEAAQQLGYAVIDRVTKSITLKTYPVGPDAPVEEVYQIQDVIDFTTKRKRMSIVVRFPDGRLCIFCKGADSVIKARLTQSALAIQTASQVKEETEKRAKAESENEIIRQSQDRYSKRTINKFGMSLQVPSLSRKSTSMDRASFELDSIYEDSRRSRDRDRTGQSVILDTLVRDAESLDEAGLFERCFKHIDGFAAEGLRTLVYAYRFIGEGEYASWAPTFNEATTSLTNRQERIEQAGELIEKNFDLAGATAIEDKLQKGVPETIEKLQRANMKIWMLTGDKRETAINIAHSAHICKKYTQTIILHHDRGEIESQIDDAKHKIMTGRHTVLVIDGQLLSTVSSNHFTAQALYSLLILSSSVICCRASPSQKASLVKIIRQLVPAAVTLAIGDGGNDISMIQEAHVGVGISGKEGLQAARVADFSIGQFRYLQRLLLVHGHWNYVRTAKNVLWTFWKEMLFYCIQILYTRWTGYTGTSLYENTSLIVWNTLFTSLCVIIPGVFEQDLSAETLLAVPELYAYGQQSRGFNLRIWGWWMVYAGVQSVVIWFCVFGIYGTVQFTKDQGLFAIGNLCFSVCVVYINIKLLLVSTHNRTLIPLLACLITVGGWWIWNFFLVLIGPSNPSMSIKDGFTHQFGANPLWWLTLIVTVAVLLVTDLGMEAVAKWYWPSKIEVWQELEQRPEVKRKLREVGGNGGYGVGTGVWGRKEGEGKGEGVDGER